MSARLRETNALLRKLVEVTDTDDFEVAARRARDAGFEMAPWPCPHCGGGTNEASPSPGWVLAVASVLDEIAQTPANQARALMRERTR